MSEDRLRVLAGRIGRSHPLFSLAERTAAAHPSYTDQIALAAADWAAYAGTRGQDPLALGHSDFVAIISGLKGHTQYVRRVGLPLLWDTLNSDGSREDAFAGLRRFDLRKATEKRLTHDERDRIVADGIRDLRNGPRQIGAARDLLAIGLLGNGVTSLEEISRLQRGDLGASGYVDTDAGRLLVGEDVLKPAVVLDVLLERLLGPLRDEDALVPAIGARYLSAYRCDDRQEMVSADPKSLWPYLGKRLRRAGVELVYGRRAWASPSWFVGVSDGTFRLPPDLALTLMPAKRSRPIASTTPVGQAETAVGEASGATEPEP